MNDIQKLLVCIEYTDNETKTNSLKDFSEYDWDTIYSESRNHGVSEFLYQCIKDVPTKLPIKVKKSLKEDFLKSAYRNILYYQSLEKILRRFNDLDIPVIVLKGAYLAEYVYANIALRQMSDVDLLVQEKDMEQTDTMLLRMGFIPTETNRIITKKGMHFSYKAKGFPIIEVHWALSGWCAEHMDIKNIWNKAVPVQIAQCSAFTLCPEDLLIYTCLHMIHHIDSLSLRMLLDVCEIIKKFKKNIDWQTVKTRSNEWRTQKAVYAVLLVSKELLKVPVSDHSLNLLKEDSIDMKYISFLKEQFIGSIKTSFIPDTRSTLLFSKKKRIEKIALLKEVFFPSKDNMSLHYPASKDSWKILLYYPILWAEIVKRNFLSYSKLMPNKEVGRKIIERHNEILEARNWFLGLS